MYIVLIFNSDWHYYCELSADVKNLILLKLWLWLRSTLLFACYAWSLLSVLSLWLKMKLRKKRKILKII